MRFLLALLPALLAMQAAPTYDVVLRNGRVLDPESGFDGVRSVGIAGRKIAALSAAPLRGRVEVDATGLVVTPGFIDLHSHGQTPENYRYKAMDGVTTALELEVGVSPVGEWYAAREGKALVNFYCWLIEKATHASYGIESADTYAWIDNASEEIFAENPRIRKVKHVGSGAYIAVIPRY